MAETGAWARSMRRSSALRNTSRRSMPTSWTPKRLAGQRTTREPHVALGNSDSVADVAGTVAVHVACGRVREWRNPAFAQPHVELSHHQRIANIDHAIP